MLCFFCIYRKL